MTSINLSTASLQKLGELYGEGVVAKAMSAALSRTTAKAATQISKLVRHRYNVKARDIRGALKIQRWARDRNRVLLYSGGHIALNRFTPTAKTVTVNVNRGGKTWTRQLQQVQVRVRKGESGGRKVVTGAWLAKGHVMRRKDLEQNNSDPTIRYGPAIAQMVDNSDVLAQLQEMVREDLPRQFINRMENEIWKAANTA